MIMELNILVQYQGEMIDNIVENVSIAKSYVEKGEKEVVKSEKNMKCGKKIKMIIIIVIIAVILIIILPIIIKFI